VATGSPLNEAQQRRLLSHAKYADELLSDFAAILNASESKSILPKYVSDVSLAQAKLVRDYIVRFRDQLAREMDGLGIRLSRNRTPQEGAGDRPSPRSVFTPAAACDAAARTAGGHLCMKFFWPFTSISNSGERYNNVTYPWLLCSSVAIQRAHG